MRSALSALWVLGAVGLWACGGKTVEPRPLPPRPVISSFQADKARLTAGESTTLSFTAENATEVELVDNRGNRIELSGTALEGSAVVAPDESRFYVLRVSGDGGRVSAFVQVAVDEDLRQVFLVAVPTTIAAGESAQLLWSAIHAKTATIRSGTGAELPIDAAAGAGVVDLTPERSETYELIASGAAGEQRASATVSVRPVLVTAGIAPAAANVGEEIHFSWTTRAASEVTVSERTFGQLHKSAAPAEQGAVDGGNFTWKVPGSTPGGATVAVGFPLEFTVTVKQSNPEVTLTRVFPSFVGNVPRITTLTAPSAVTEGKKFLISWTTQNASRIQVFANGSLVYEPLARDQASVARGSVQLGAPREDTTYEVVAWGFAGTSVTERRGIRLVKAPVITAFNLPLQVAAEADAAHATWKTQYATSVNVSVKHGISLFASTDPAVVADGAADVHPGVRTTFVLEAWNDAGDRAVEERTVDIAAPGTFTAEPKPVTEDTPVTVTWAISPTGAAQVYGDPNQAPVKNNPATDFVNLATHPSALPLAFVDNNDGISRVPVPAGFRVPMGGVVASEFWASTNGFLSFKNVGPRPNNVGLDTPTLTHRFQVVAPFWDDLVLGATGKVLYLVDGTQFPRRLIVQWNQVQTAPDPSSVLTFQAQLYETGEVRLAYQTLTGALSRAESASVGWHLDSSLNDELANSGGAALNPGDELVFFGAGAVSGSYAAQPSRSAVFTLVARTPGGAYVVYPGAVNVVPRNSVLVNEAMLRPEATAVSGRWVELLNVSDDEIDLSGVTLNALSTSTSWTFPDGSVLPAGEFLVLGESKEPALNGGVPVDIEWGSLVIDPAVDSALTLSVGLDPVSSLSYTAAALVAGTSVNRPELAMGSTGAAIPCTPSQTFGGNGALGTPGAENETCFEYSLRSIPVNYRDISLDGTALFLTGDDMDEQAVSHGIPTAPFTFFGAPCTQLFVTTNGFVTCVPLTGSAYPNNDLKPDSNPAGVIAPLWDDLDDKAAGGPANVFVQRIEPGEDGSAPVGHWIVQWHQLTARLLKLDNMNFQVKLFDDGTIEFHYAEMTSGTAGYAAGSDATIWVSRPSGDAALTIGVKQPVISSYSGYRFSPKSAGATP